MDDRAELIRRPGKYRKKPVVIEAALFDGKIVGVPDGRGGVIPSTCPTWFPAVVKNVAYGEGVLCKPGETIFVDDHLHVGTLEGTMVVSPGDWVIRGVKGEIYPCKPDIFTATYEAADALEAAPAVPDGWKLVPIEPTTGMFRALTSWVKGNEALDVIMGKWLLGRFREDYLAMLAAAPEAPGHVPTPSPAAEPVALASARQEGFEAGLKAAVDRYADAETWDYFLAAEEAILALSTKEGAEG